MSHIEQIPDECRLLKCTQALFPEAFIILGQVCARAFLKKNNNKRLYNGVIVLEEYFDDFYYT